MNKKDNFLRNFIIGMLIGIVIACIYIYICNH